MKLYDTFQLFWTDYAQTQPNSHGFNDWVMVKYLHIDDATFAMQQRVGSDELGFQPLWLTFANPLNKTVRQTLIKGVDDSTLSGFLDYSREMYLEQLDARFGSFKPGEFHAFAEYDTWEAFYKTWLERAGQSVLNHHIPLLFDHTPNIEYWTRKQTGLEVLPHQRLLLTSYFAPKNEFFDFFIKNVDDAEMHRIKLLSQSRIRLNLDKLYAVSGVA